MSPERTSRLKIFARAAIVVVTLAWSSYAHKEAIKSDDSLISQTGLLPVYGVDLAFDVDWVDGAQFPSRSASHPYFGVNTAFQQTWDALKPSGFNIVRLPIDVRDPQSAAGRVANLCVWAKNNNVKLIPILVGADRRQPIGFDYSLKVSSFVKMVTKALGKDEGKSFQAYSQVLAYQLENSVNHAGLHGSMPPQSAQLRLLQAAGALRKAEQDSLKDTGLNVTPLMINASFDYELIKVRAIAGARLTDAAFAQAYDSLKQFLVEFAASSDIDLIGVDWFAGSLSAGSAEKLSTLLRRLTPELMGKQVVLTTGFSTGFNSSEEQEKFYALAFSNLADYRAGDGLDSQFIGIFFHEALNGKDSNIAPPTPRLSREMLQWNWAERADELARMWNGQSASEAIAWWSQKVENNFGLLAMKPDGARSVTIARQPAQEDLQQIAAAVTEANRTSETNDASSSERREDAITNESFAGREQSYTDPTLRRALKAKAQQSLMLLIDRVVERLGDKISRNQSGGIQSGYQNNSQNIPASIVPLMQDDVSFEPTNPQASQPLTCKVTLRNQSADADASRLIIAMVDNVGNVLAEVRDIIVARGAAQTFELSWTPVAPQNYQLSVKVSDANLTELTRVSLNAITVYPSQSGGIGDPGQVGSPSPAQFYMPFGSPKIQALTVGTVGDTPVVGHPSPVMLSMANPYARSLTDIRATLLVDGLMVETKMMGTLLPQQSRSILFANVPFSSPGPHEIRVRLESSGAGLQRGLIIKQIQVGPNTGSIRGDQADGWPTARFASPARPVLPPSIRVGRLELPTRGPVSSSPRLEPRRIDNGSVPATDPRKNERRGASPAEPRRNDPGESNTSSVDPRRGERGRTGAPLPDSRKNDRGTGNPADPQRGDRGKGGTDSRRSDRGSASSADVRRSDEKDHRKGDKDRSSSAPLDPRKSDRDRSKDTSSSTPVEPRKGDREKSKDRSSASPADTRKQEKDRKRDRDRSGSSGGDPQRDQRASGGTPAAEPHRGDRRDRNSAGANKNQARATPSQDENQNRRKRM